MSKPEYSPLENLTRDDIEVLDKDHSDCGDSENYNINRLSVQFSDGILTTEWFDYGDLPGWAKSLVDDDLDADSDYARTCAAERRMGY